ncbi:MAG TPA: TetR/AcrR family transcriptional regulator [Thermoleophilia bacterium]|nr:TetR/AcrR family transcriptional regulator [Thermoleophilia bacterium]
MPATKDEIAAKFMELAFHFGYRRTAVEDVARELHVSKKTVYEHFASKSDLMRYGLELTARGQRARVESMLTEPTALGRVQQVIGIALADVRAFYESRPHGEMAEPPEIQAEINELVYAPMVRDVLVHGVEAGEFSVADPDVTAAFVVAMGMEAVRMIRDDPACRPEELLFESVRRMIGGRES